MDIDKAMEQLGQLRGLMLNKKGKPRLWCRRYVRCIELLEQLTRRLSDLAKDRDEWQALAIELEGEVEQLEAELRVYKRAYDNMAAENMVMLSKAGLKFKHGFLEGGKDGKQSS